MLHAAALPGHTNNIGGASKPGAAARALSRLGPAQGRAGRAAPPGTGPPRSMASPPLPSPFPAQPTRICRTWGAAHAGRYQAARPQLSAPAPGLCRLGCLHRHAVSPTKVIPSRFPARLPLCCQSSALLLPDPCHTAQDSRGGCPTLCTRCLLPTTHRQAGGKLLDRGNRAEVCRQQEGLEARLLAAKRPLGGAS